MEKANSDTAVNNVLELFKSRKCRRRQNQREKKGKKEQKRKTIQTSKLLCRCMC